MHEFSSEDCQTAPFHLDRNHIFLFVIDWGQLLIDGFAFNDLDPAIERVVVAARDSPEAAVGDCRVLERNPEAEKSIGLAEHVAGILVRRNFSSNFGRL